MPRTRLTKYLAFLALGCATTTQLYEGPRLPSDQAVFVYEGNPETAQETGDILLERLVATRGVDEAELLIEEARITLHATGSFNDERIALIGRALARNVELSIHIQAQESDFAGSDTTLAGERTKLGDWVRANYAELKTRAETTTSIGKLVDIEQYQAGRMMFLRFDYTTGDAAGQNMTGRATDAACKWIETQVPTLVSYNLEGNFATDKKHSQINTLRTRGKRVVAEAVLSKELVADILHTTPYDLFRARQLSTVGCLLSASNNNGSHSANGITAMFIATGQDVACVAESSAAIAYAEITPEGDYYYSITIPSLIIATHGGGTGLATQRECLEVLGCYGSGKVYKLAEIIGATVLAGELSLGAAVVTDTWVSSHEKLGRNR